MVRDSNDTLGGGVALVLDAPRHRRNDHLVVEHLRILSEGRSEDVVFHAIDALRVANRKQISDATHMLPSEIDADISSLVSSGRLIQLSLGANPLYTTQTRHSSMLRSSLEALKDYHQRYPLRRGMPREELRNRLSLSGSSFDAVAASFLEGGLIGSGRQHYPVERTCCAILRRPKARS